MITNTAETTLENLNSAANILYFRAFLSYFWQHLFAVITKTTETNLENLYSAANLLYLLTFFSYFC